MSKREVILQAVVAALTPIQATAGRVFRAREDALSEYESPAIIVMPMQEAPAEFTNGYVEARLQFAAMVYARAPVAPDAVADPVVEEVHARLMTDPTLGGSAIDLAEVGTEWEFDQTDQTVVLVRTMWSAWYRHARESLAA